MTKYLILVGSGLLVSGIVSTAGAAPPPWKAPVASSGQANPYSGKGSAIARGKEIYQGVCIACHGNAGKGDGPAGLALLVRPGDLTAPGVKAQTEGELMWKITHGRPPMPGFAGAYGKEDLWKIVSYLRTLTPGAETGPAPSAVAATPTPDTTTAPDAAAAPGGGGPVSRGEYNRLQREMAILKGQLAALLEKEGIAPEEITPIMPSGAGTGEVGTSTMDWTSGAEADWGEAVQLPPGHTNFLLSGYMTAGFNKLQGDNSSFSASFQPIFLWKQGESLFFEGELELEVEDNETEVGLEYAQMFWTANDYLTLGAGKFLSPQNYFSERLHPAWINKLPSAPLPFAHGTALIAGSQLGVQARGGVPLGSTRLGYAFYLSNGPSMAVGEEGEEGDEEEGEGGEEHGEPAGSLEFNNFSDRNNNKAVGGRIGFLPIPALEIGYGFEVARVDPSGSRFSGVDAVSHTVDANYVKNVDSLKGLIDARAQFVWQNVDSLGAAPLDFNNNSKGGYVQLAYRPMRLNNEFLRNMEAIGRYDWVDQPAGRADIDRMTFGINYWLNSNTVLKVAYELGEESGEGETRNFYGIRAQAAMGF
ncbi:MAG: c-type cytochrome [Verrucomicrobiales bacterium]